MANQNTNAVTLSGNCVRDPEVFTTQGGKTKTTIRLAVNNGGPAEAPYPPTFIDVVAWNGRGENASKYLRQGRFIIVTGRLVRADWDTYRYTGYAGRTVTLQFRPKDSSTYTTVATARTNGTGDLHTMVKAAKDGYWRWNFPGTTTTGAAKATGDYVDVRP